MITTSSLGTVFDQTTTSAFCGQSRTTHDSFKTLTYGIPVFLIPFVHLAVGWQLFASILRSTSSDNYTVAEILPAALLPGLVILLHGRIWEHTRKKIRNEKSYRNNVCFMFFLHVMLCILTARSESIILAPFILYGAALYQLKL